MKATSQTTRTLSRIRMTSGPFGNLSALAAALAGGFLTSMAAHATTYYWDVNGTAAGFTSVVGTWDGSTAAWNSDATGGAGGTLVAAPGSTDDLIIPPATTNTGSLTVSGDQSASSITFAANVGPTVTLSGGSSITIGGAGTKSGIFESSSGANTITTPVTLNGAVNAFNFSATSSGLLTMGAVTGAATSGTQTITVGSSGSGGITLNGIIGDGSGGGNVALTVNNTSSGVTTLSAANTYSGATTVNAGSLTLTGSLTSASLAMGGGKFTYSTAGTNTQSFAAGGTSLSAGVNAINNTVATDTLNLGALTRTTGATLDFTTATGAIATSTGNSSGALLGGYATFGGSTWATNNGTKIVGLASYTTTTTAGTTAANYAAADIDVTNSAGTLGGAITPNSLRFNTAAAETVTLAASTVNAIGSGGILVTSAVGAASANNSTITGGSITSGNGQDLVIIHNNPNVSNNQNGEMILSSAIVNNGATPITLTKSGNGWLYLGGGVNNTYSGGTIINAGTIEAGAGAFGSSQITFAGNSYLLPPYSTATTLTNSIAVNPGVTADLNVINQYRNITLSGVVSGSGTLWVDSTSVGVYASGGNGAGTVTLSNTANTFTGTVQIGNSSYGSTLTVASLPDSANPVKIYGVTASSHYGYLTFSGGTSPRVYNNRQFQLFGAAEWIQNNNSSAANTITINTPLQVNATTTMTLGGSNTGSNTFGGVIANGGAAVLSLTKAGVGTWVLSNANNTFTGTIATSGTTTSAGTLEFASAGGANPITVTQTTSTFTLKYSGAGQTMSGLVQANALSTGALTLNASGTGPINFSNTGSLGVGGGSGAKNLTLTGTNTGANTLAEVWANNTAGGAATLTKSAAGTWVLSGANTYTGNTTLSGGTLNLGAAETAGTSGPLGKQLATAAGTIILGGGKLQYSAANQNDYSGRFSTGASQAYNVDVNGQPVTWATSLTSSGGSLTLTDTAGGGTLTLSSGTNTYSGATTINGGTLALGAGGALPTGTAVSIGSATLDAGTSANSAGTLNATGTAVINLGSGGTLAFADSHLVSWAGTLNITGTFVAGLSIRFGASNSALTSGQLAVISVNGSGAGTYTLDSNGYLISGGGPGPVDHFIISTIGSPQTVGTPITGITLTAQDASNNTATGFTGTVGFSGTGGFSGTSASFTAGVLSGVSVTPTVAGSNLTFMVTDGVSGKNGSTTITTIQSQYDAWSGGAAFDADSNGDGVNNGLAWLLGASNKNANASALLPVPADSSGNLLLTFDCLSASDRGSAVLNLQYSKDLGITDAWSGHEVAVPGVVGTSTVGGVNFTATANGSLIHVVAEVPASAASPGTTVFGRLRANQP